MNREQVQTILEKIANFYPGKFQFPTGVPARDGGIISDWHELLRFYPLEVVQKGLTTYVQTGTEWPPSLGQLIGQIRKLVEPERISGGQAWQMVIRLINKYGAHYGASQIKKELPSDVWDTVMIFGLEAIGSSSVDDTYLMSQFIKQHEMRMDHKAERELLNPARERLQLNGGNSNEN